MTYHYNFSIEFNTNHVNFTISIPGYPQQMPQMMSPMMPPLMSPMFSPMMNSAMMDPTAMMRSWKFHNVDSTPSSVYENSELAPGDQIILKINFNLI